MAEQTLPPEAQTEIYQKGQEILSELGLTAQELEGQKVLDLGSGKSQVGDYLSSVGIDCTSLDFHRPDLVYYGSHKRVEAEAEHLPFADNTFDKVVSRLGPPMLAGTFGGNFFEDATPQEIQEFMQNLQDQVNEVKRVLKPGGEFRITPVELQFLANQAFRRAKNKNEAEFEEEMEREMRKVEQESIQLYEEMGLKGIGRQKNLQGIEYLVWVKP